MKALELVAAAVGPAVAGALVAVGTSYVVSGTSARSVRAIGEVSAGYGNLVAAALGVPRRPRCGAQCYYPTGGAWSLIVCPLEADHRGLHADDTLFPFWSDDDAEWFAIHYRLCTMGALT